jgi:hypothetical protein
MKKQAKLSVDVDQYTIMPKSKVKNCNWTRFISNIQAKRI